MAAIQIRPARPDDAADILQFIIDLAIYEEAGHEVEATVAQAGVAQGCRRMEWSVLNWNQPAIRVYNAIGGQPQSEWTRYRLAGDDLIQFAASGNSISG